LVAVFARSPATVKCLVPVLLYHSVTDEPRDRYTVARSEFEAQMQAIESSGFVPVRISELAAWLRRDQPIADRAIAITFDDGYDNTFSVTQWLHEKDICSTVYITTSEIGAPARLSHEQVLELAQMPSVEVGAHGVRHMHLDELDKRAVIDEVAVSKAQLEEVAGFAVDSFAYPHGAYDQHVRQAVVDAGYTSAAAVKNALSHSADDPYAIARWMVMADTSVSRIREVIEGKKVPVAWSGERLRTRAYRMARRARRRFVDKAETSGGNG
jgi:peptidoglycan/xylan/chitin deacetylase (PgdA/CDA1 family)